MNVKVAVEHNPLVFKHGPLHVFIHETLGQSQVEKLSLLHNKCTHALRRFVFVV